MTEYQNNLGISQTAWDILIVIVIVLMNIYIYIGIPILCQGLINGTSHLYNWIKKKITHN